MERRADETFDKVTKFWPASHGRENIPKSNRGDVRSGEGSYRVQSKHAGVRMSLGIPEVVG